MPSPIKRQADKTSRSQPASGAARVGEMWEVKVPPARKGWHPMARDIYNSLKTSGQSVYYQNSDWRMAQAACDIIDFIWKGSFQVRGSAMLMGEANSILEKLGVTEGARIQAMRVELEHPVEEEMSEEEATLLDYERMLEASLGD